MVDGVVPSSEFRIHVPRSKSCMIIFVPEYSRSEIAQSLGMPPHLFRTCKLILDDRSASTFKYLVAWVDAEGSKLTVSTCEAPSSCKLNRRSLVVKAAGRSLLRPWWHFATTNEGRAPTEIRKSGNVVQRAPMIVPSRNSMQHTVQCYLTLASCCWRYKALISGTCCHASLA